MPLARPSSARPALLALLVAALAGPALPDAALAAPPDDRQWAWLGADGGTYWYVPTEHLQAIRWQADAPDDAAPVADQTVWHIERYERGYFFGPVVARLAGAPTSCQYLIGSITPDGRVYIAFQAEAPGGTGDRPPPQATIGIGTLLDNDGPVFRMQMASGQQTMVAHWADMRRCREGEPCWNALPGTGASIPDTLAGCDDD